MKKETVIKIVLVFMLLSFFLGFFWPVLFTPQAENGGNPSPSAQAELSGAFNADAVAQGLVLELDRRMVLACGNANATLMQEFKAGLDSNPRIERAIGIAATGAFDLLFSENSTASDYDRVASDFQALCPAGSAARRALQIEFPNAISFNSTDNSTGSTAGSARLPPYLCGQQNWNCLVSPETTENSTATFKIGITRTAGGSGSEQGFMQEIAAAFSSTPPAQAPSPSSDGSNQANQTGGGTEA